MTINLILIKFPQVINYNDRNYNSDIFNYVTLVFFVLMQPDKAQTRVVYPSAH